MKAGTAEDKTRHDREGKTCLTVRSGEDTARKLALLRGACSTGIGNSDRAMLVALALGLPVTSHVDETAIAHLGKMVGLLKLSAVTFRPGINLNVNALISRIEKIRHVLLHGRSGTERSVNKIDVEDTGKKTKRIGFYVDAIQRAEIKRNASKAGLSVAGYLRALVDKKEITSRLSLESTEEIRCLGALIRAAITIEEERQDGQPAEDIIRLLAEADNLLRRIETEVRQ
ncbi:MAG: hypothetical protein DELT_02574 [Desulfovibrio sp.]